LSPNSRQPSRLVQATGFSRPYPGEKKVRPASEFNKAAPAKDDDDDKKGDDQIAFRQ
jgi:hypothetical protein